MTYLRPARGRGNLTVRSHALVDHAIVRGQRAVGLCLAPGAETVWAERIVLAAGAYGSPPILLRSALGPAAHLAALGIPLVADLPGVGRQLSDHPMVGVSYAALDAAARMPKVQMLLTWRSAGTTVGYDVHVLPVSPPEYPTLIILGTALVKPLSRGYARLQSADPSAAPLIDSGFLSHRDNLPRMIEAVRLARELARTPPVSDRLGPAASPAARAPDEPEALAEAIRATVGTYAHPVGTCQMGPAGDREAVVDARGQVHGLANLYVVDASIMPTIPAANTNLPTLLLAERCAAMMLDDL
jgi:choline dehydrogenase